MLFIPTRASIIVLDRIGEKLKKIGSTSSKTIFMGLSSLISYLLSITLVAAPFASSSSKAKSFKAKSQPTVQDANSLLNSPSLGRLKFLM